MSKVLFIGAHADDELTSAATLVKLLSKGHDVTYVALTYLDNYILLKESQSAMGVLGVTDLMYYKFQVRKFQLVRQDILEVLVKLNAQIKPHIVFCPSSQELHQDHKVVFEECQRAFKTQEVYGWIMPWNQLHTYANCPSEITVEQLEQKVKAMASYQTQKAKDYFSPDYIRSLAKVCGVQFKCEYAESFEMIRARL